VIAAVVAALALLAFGLLLIVVTLMGGLAPASACDGDARYAPSGAALSDIPGNYLRWLQDAGARYGLDWTVIAGIYSIESDFGRSRARGVRSGENFAGAGGPGQFLSGTWASYGVDGEGDGIRNRYDPADAIPGSANLLRQNGAPADYGRAVFAYNHASWYVEDVLAAAARYRGAAQSQPDAVQMVAAADAAEAECSAVAVAAGPANLDVAVRLTSPTAYRPLPQWAMAGGRPVEPVDARIYADVVWVLRRYNRRVMAAREAGHHTHGDGTAVDLVPAIGSSQRDWTPRPAGSPTTSAGSSRAERLAPALPARSSRRSSGLAMTATKTTARREPARVAARRTSTCRGCRAAMDQARSSRRARGSWRSPRRRIRRTPREKRAEQLQLARCPVSTIWAQRYGAGRAWHVGIEGCSPPARGQSGRTSFMVR
jgi:hypothetical protein